MMIFAHFSGIVYRKHIYFSRKKTQKKEGVKPPPLIITPKKLITYQKNFSQVKLLQESRSRKK